MAVMNLTNGDPRYYAYGVNGAMFMQIAHGITSTGMFFLVGVIYDRAHTRDLKKLGGLFNIMPIYGAVSFLIFFGSMGLPGLCGFVAEAFVILASFNYNIPLTVLAAASVILTAGYILWTLQRVFLGRAKTDDAAHGHDHGHDHAHGHDSASHGHAYPDLNLREMVIAAPPGDLHGGPRRLAGPAAGLDAALGDERGQPGRRVAGGHVIHAGGEDAERRGPTPVPPLRVRPRSASVS